MMTATGRSGTFPRSYLAKWEWATAIARLASRQVSAITGRPRRVQSLELIGSRVCREYWTTTTLAADPMMVPLPPNPAPKAIAHQKGSGLTPVEPR